MSLLATLPKIILDTVIGRLIPLFLAAAGGDAAAARDAAIQMLAAYDVETPEELTLAAEIIGLQFQALESLADAAGPDRSLNQTLRLRGSAVSLSRESHKAQRKLDQVQRARRTVPQPAASPAEPPAAQPASGAPEKEALDLVAAAQEAIRIAQKTGGRNWAQNLQKRMMTAQIAENAKQQQAKYAGQNATAPQPAD